MGARFLEDGFVVTGRYTAFSNNKKMVTFPHKELEHKVEKDQNIELEVMWPKTKTNMNFHPKWTITDQSTLTVCEERGGLINSPRLKRGGLLERGGGLNRGFTVWLPLVLPKQSRLVLGRLSLQSRVSRCARGEYRGRIETPKAGDFRA